MSKALTALSREHTATAVPIDPNIPRATAVVSLIPFVIIGPKEVGYAEQLVNDPFTVNPPQTVEWSFVGLAFGAKIDRSGIFTGPIKTQVGAATYIIIRATNKTDATQYAEFQVYFKKRTALGLPIALLNAFIYIMMEATAK